MTKKNNNYDFDLIISNEDLKRNREKIISLQKNKTKKRKLKRLVKNLLWILLGGFIGIVFYQIFTIKTTTQTSVGNYTCHGGIVKICSSSAAVADYLGVE